MSDIGRQQILGIGKETTRNTVLTTATTWLPWMVWDVNVKNMDFKDESAAGVRDQIMTTEIAGQIVEAKLEGKLDADLFHNILFYLMGQGTPTTALSATTWNFTSLNSISLPSFTAFYTKALESSPGTRNWYKVTGCTIKELDLKADAGGDASYSVTIIGLLEQVSSTQTPAYTKPTNYLYGKYIKIGYATNVAGLSSPTFFDAESISLKINNNSKEDMALGSIAPVDIFSQQYTVEAGFSAKVKFATGTVFDGYHKAGTKAAWLITMVNSNAAVIGTSTLKPTINFTVAMARLSIDYKTDRDNLVKLDCKLIPEFSFTDGYTVSAQVINSKPAIL